MKPVVPVVVMFKPSSTIVDRHRQSTSQRSNTSTNIQLQLHNAAKHNDIETLHKLVQQGASLTYLHTKGNSVLHTAACHGSVDFIQELCKSLPSEEVRRLVNRANEYGSTPLHSAAKKGHVKSIDLLLSLGADPGIQDHRKRTPLDLAFKSKCAKAIESLKDLKPPQDSFISGGSPKTPTAPKPTNLLTQGGSFIKRESSNIATSALNPFAVPFSPRSAAPQIASDALQLPGEAELVESGELQYPDESTTEPQSALVLIDQGALPMPPVRAGRLNVFTGEWDDPFTPQQTEQVALKGLSILNRINTKRPLEEAVPVSRSINRNPGGHNIFLGHSDPFTPVDRPDEAQKNPFHW